MNDMKTLEDIKKKLIQAGSKLAQKYNLDLMIVFGSYAVGKERANSDLDVGVIGDLDFNVLLDLTNEITKLLGLKVVEVVNLKKASPLLTHNALRKAVIIFERTAGTLSDARLSALHRFVETKSLREVKFNRTRKYIKEYTEIQQHG